MVPSWGWDPDPDSGVESELGELTRGQGGRGGQSAPAAQTWPVTCVCVTPWAENGFYTFKRWGEEN